MNKPEFQEKSSDVAHERIFDVAFVCLRPEPQEVEVIRVFQDLSREPRLTLSKPTLKVRHSSAFAHMKSFPDLQIERLARPGMHNCLSCIPLANRWIA